MGEIRDILGSKVEYCPDCLCAFGDKAGVKIHRDRKTKNGGVGCRWKGHDKPHDVTGITDVRGGGRNMRFFETTHEDGSTRWTREAALSQYKGLLSQFWGTRPGEQKPAAYDHSEKLRCTDCCELLTPRHALVRPWISGSGRSPPVRRRSSGAPATSAAAALHHRHQPAGVTGNHGLFEWSSSISAIQNSQNCTAGCLCMQ